MNGLHGIIFSYERRGELRELGEIRSSASIPFGGRYRAVDFPLSNLVDAGATNVGIVLHGHYQSLLDHLGTGKDWDLSRKRGGLRMLPPFNSRQSWGIMPFRGKMEALAGIRSYLDTIRQDYVALMDGDLVANLPLRDILDSHVKTGADITVVCGNDSFATSDGTYFEVRDGRITEVLFNLHQPRGYRGLEVYILSTKLLLELVDECAGKDKYNWRRDVLQARKDTLNLRATRLLSTLTPISSVVTKITLEKATSKQGKPYALFNFQTVSMLSPEEAAQAKAFGQKFMEIVNAAQLVPELAEAG